MSEFGKPGVAVRNIERADAGAVERLGRAGRRDRARGAGPHGTR